VCTVVRGKGSSKRKQNTIPDRGWYRQKSPRVKKFPLVWEKNTRKGGDAARVWGGHGPSANEALGGKNHRKSLN